MSIVVVFAQEDTRRFISVVHDLVRDHERAVVVAAADARSLEPFADMGVTPLIAPSAPAAVNAVWQEHRQNVFVVTDAVLIPDDALRRAEVILAGDLRNASVSFFSNDAGPLSFPVNHPTPMPIPNLDHESTTRLLRTVSPELAPCPVPYAAGGAVLVSNVVLDALQGLESPPDGVSFDAALADFSMRGRERGFVDLLDPGTFVTRLPTPGREMHHPLMPEEDREWLLVRHPQLIEAFERERAVDDLPLEIVTRFARVKATGLRVLIDDATLGPIETGAQITTLAIIDALAKRDDVSEVGVALGHQIPDYAREVMGRPKIRPGFRDGHDYSLFQDYDVAHRTAQPDKHYEVAAARTAARRVVVTVLDLIAYRAGSYHATTDDWLEYRGVLRKALREADAVTTISEDVASALEIERMPMERDRVFPVLYGTEHLDGTEATEFPAELAVRGKIASEFLVCLGTNYAHKNRDLAIAVQQELCRRGLEVTLVLAGASVPFGGTLASERRLLGGGDDVIFLPSVNSRERNWLFRHAAVVLYPTSAEGFGLVPFEAARFGAPTVTVAFGPLLETSHDVPVVAASWSARDFADSAERLLRDPDLRQAQVNATLRAADRYSWDRTADEFTRMYRQLLSRSKR